MLVDRFRNVLTYTPSSTIVQYVLQLDGSPVPSTLQLAGNSSNDVTGSKAVSLGSGCVAEALPVCIPHPKYQPVGTSSIAPRPCFGGNNNG